MTVGSLAIAGPRRQVSFDAVADGGLQMQAQDRCDLEVQPWWSEIGTQADWVRADPDLPGAGRRDRVRVPGHQEHGSDVPDVARHDDVIARVGGASV